MCADLATLETVFPLMQHALLEVGFEVSLAKTTLVVLCLSVQATFACTRWSFVVSGCLLSPSQRAVTVVTRTLFPLILP